MGMTDAQYKDFVAGILNDINEFEELRKSENPALQEYAEKKINKLKARLQEALER